MDGASLAAMPHWNALVDLMTAEIQQKVVTPARPNISQLQAVQGHRSVPYMICSYSYTYMSADLADRVQWLMIWRKAGFAFELARQYEVELYSLSASQPELRDC